MENLPVIGYVNKIGENHPSSDIYTDIKLLRKRIDDQDVTIKCLMQKFQRESDLRKAEAERQNAEAEKQREEITKLKSQLIDLGYIRTELEEKTSQHHVFVGINEFYEEKKREIEDNPKTEPEDKEKQKQQLKEIIKEARKRRSSKIVCNAIHFAEAGGLLCGTTAAVTAAKWAPFVALKLAACPIAITGIGILGSVCIGGILVGLAAYGGYLLYVKCKEVKVNE